MREPRLRHDPGKLSGKLFLGRGRNLRIGGIDIVISPEPALRLRIANPLYRPFIVNAVAEKKASHISLHLKIDQWPEYHHLEKIFDTQDSWSMCRDKKYFWLSLAPVPHQDPLWVARFERRLKRVDLYCRTVVQGKGGKNIIDLPMVYPLDQLLLMYYLAWRKGMLVHAAGMVHGGRSFLFAGASGAGKSTFSGLLAAARVGKLLSDERMIVREIAGTMTAFGTPWAGTSGVARAGSAPLAGIYFLRHGRDNCIEKLAAAEALDRLLPLVSIPWYDPGTLSSIIAFAKHFLANVPAFEMGFKPDRSAIDFFWTFSKNPT
jgi:hypothetical protein